MVREGEEVYNMPKPYKVLTIYRESQALPRQHYTNNKYYATKKGVENRVLCAIREPALVDIGIYLDDGNGMWTEIAHIGVVRYTSVREWVPYNPLLDCDKIAAFFGNDRVVAAIRQQWPEWAKKEE